VKIGDALEVTRGPFAGRTATVVAIAGDSMRVDIELFGRTVTIELSGYDLTPPDTSMPALEHEVVRTAAAPFARRLGRFWRDELARTPPRDPAERAAAFAAWAEPIEQARHAAELDALARFRAAFGKFDDAARAARWRADQAVWTDRVDPLADEPLDEAAVASIEALREDTERWQRTASLAAEPAEPVGDPRDEALERRIERDVGSDAGFLVYADWLQAQGHPQGELVALSAAGVTEAALLQRRLEPRLLGRLAAFADRLALRWRLGFVDAIRLETTRADERDGIDIAQLVRIALRTPALRFARELTIALPSIHERVDLHAALVAAGARPALRSLALVTNGDEEMLSWTSAGELSGLAALYPNLESLEVEAGSYTLTAPRFPRLARLVLQTCGGTRDQLWAVADADWPRLSALEMWFGSAAYGVDIGAGNFEVLLASPRMPALRSLALCNCELTDELCEAIVRSPLLPQLRALSLAKGTMTDAGAAVLVAHADRLRHLDGIDVGDNYLDDDTLAALRAALPQVTGDDQRAADVDDGVARRYAPVGE
jgi:uncharacterized protein (TIGR02996 family)